MVQLKPELSVGRQLCWGLLLLVLHNDRPAIGEQRPITMIDTCSSACICSTTLRSPGDGLPRKDTRAGRVFGRWLLHAAIVLALPSAVLLHTAPVF